MDNEKEIKKNSMYIEVENEEEILRLQQEAIKSNLPIEDVAKIVGKLQKLLELTKCNSNNAFSLDYGKMFDWTYKPNLDSQPLFNTPITPISAGSLYSVDNTSTGTNVVSSTSPVSIRNDVPF